MMERLVSAHTRGRYLAIPSSMPKPAPVLVGFHGYAESAEIQLERLRAIPGSDQWLIVSVEALHHFYRGRTNEVGASWMTRQHREMAIADNIAYVKSCLDSAIAEWHALPVVVFAGFSQGVAMAFRAAANATQKIAGVIAVGGDVPPEITADQLRRIPRVLLVRGAADNLYSDEQFAKDQQRLRVGSVSLSAIQLDAGHEWAADLSESAARFLASAILSERLATAFVQ
jgi:predicted esterase